jgi:acetolactate synthase-1/2/3 large subunit
MGPLQDIPHTEILAPICRYSRTARVAEQVIREFDEAISRAFGDLGEPGPVYIEIPTDVLRTSVKKTLIPADWMIPKPTRKLWPDPELIEKAAHLIRQSKRPLVITGRGGKNSRQELTRFLDTVNAVYLDTQESRGLIDRNNKAFVGAMRAAAMNGADLVITVGRKLDYQLGFGSPAVFPEAKFLRLADSTGELIDNRRGDVEVLADVKTSLNALSDVLNINAGERDSNWLDDLRDKHLKRIQKTGARVNDNVGPDGKIHPMAIFDAIAQVATDDYIAVADGGDLLSFARIGLEADTYLDAGVFGCLGVGVPFAIAASLAYPERMVISVNGDGAYGINAMEIDTAVRHGARAVFIISNNAAWNIERFDQEVNYGGRVIGTTLRHSDYAAMAIALGAHGERVEDISNLSSAISRAIENAPAVVDVVTSQQAVSSDAKKGLGFVPDYQALTAWDDAEQARRQ